MRRREFLRQSLAACAGSAVLLGSHGLMRAAARTIASGTSNLNLGLSISAGLGRDALGNPVSVPQIVQTIDGFKDSLCAKLGIDPWSEAGYRMYPATFSIWSSWSRPGNAPESPIGGGFPPFRLMNSLRDRGIMPMIFWQPSGIADGISYFANTDSTATAPNAMIRDGHYDAYLARWCAQARAWKAQLTSGASRTGRPKHDSFLLRFAHEMNGQWFPWAVGRPNAPNSGYAGEPNTVANFIEAWRHVHSVVRQVNGIADARFVYCPIGNRATQRLFYPGDDYVDYLGFDLYVNLECDDGSVGQYIPLEDRIGHCYDDICLLHPTKRVIIAEYGIRNTHQWCHPAFEGNDAARADWLRTGIPAVAARMPRIKSMVYFNLNMNTAQDDRNWELGGGRALSAYAAMARDYQTPFELP
jgi:hypothetical protein